MWYNTFDLFQELNENEIFMSKNSGKNKILIFFCYALAIALLALCVLCFQKEISSAVREGLLASFYTDYNAIAPNISSNWSKGDTSEAIGDIYVSADGDDRGEGTALSSYQTIERAMEAVSAIDKSGRTGITVCIEAGEYNVDALIFNASDGGSANCPITYRAVGGEVVINGGVTLSPSDFSPVSNYPEILERLSDEARNNVIVIDLKKAPYSLTAEDYGKLYPI